jgi:hypothetical protein
MYIDASVSPAKAKLKTCNSTDATLRFQTTLKPNGTVILRHLATDLCLTVGSDATHSSVEGWPCWGQDGFRQIAAGTGIFHLEQRIGFVPGPTLPFCLKRVGASDVAAYWCNGTYQNVGKFRFDFAGI